MSAQQELLENVKTWLSIDDQIRALQKEIRDRRKLKKELTENLVGIMKTQDIDALNVPDGQLIYNKTKTKAIFKKVVFTTMTNRAQFKYQKTLCFPFEKRERERVTTSHGRNFRDRSSTGGAGEALVARAPSLDE